RVPEQPQASYASPVVANIGKVKQYVIFTSKGICGVRAKDGEPLWGQDKSSNGTANCATPLVSNNYVFSSSDYGTGAELVELKPQGNTVKANPVYFTKDMKNHHGGMVLLDGYIYGSSGDLLSCVELKTGKPTWREHGMKGSVVYADKKIIFRNEGGPVVLLAADSKEFKELGRFEQSNRSGRPAWAHPVIADGKLYLRDQDKMLVYNLK
ncbi:MAG: PQQ-binding-like beta-propeller repeat protein, partial [Planctomycetota bacterium]|nr:PQQ-binding-like beta-propeller repeat protein [Planctomycetota bacterium]